MRKKTDESSDRFEHFLEMVNLVNSSGGNLMDINEILIPGEDDLIKREAEEVEWNSLYVKTLETVITALNFDDPAKFCQYLFNENSPQEIKTDWRSIMDSGQSLTSAISKYEIFYNDFFGFRSIMVRLNAMRNGKTLPKIGERKQVRGPRNIPVFTYIDSDGKVDFEINKDRIFFGFRDFDRVKPCDFCKNYFLAKRTDAKYCSDICGSKKRQEKWLKDEDKYQKQLKRKREDYHKNKEKHKEAYKTKIIRDLRKRRNGTL
jgi:hypothetical protein